MDQQTDISSQNDEFEREPVPQGYLKGWKSFIGVYAGEHAAGTEFMIGPLFITTGVSAFDLLGGLFLGNLLAVFTWRFLTAEIAVKYRLTLYFQLEKLCGKHLVKYYNLANGVLFCFLAGSMITVSATAVGVPFGIEMPKLTDAMPNGWTWVAIVLCIGAIISVIAASGYATVSKAANWMSPIIVIAFIWCGVEALSDLGISNFQAFVSSWGAGSDPFPGQVKYTFWHVTIWSWFCNAAMHIGMSDLSVLRFARTARAGWATAAGMYIGHYVAWIAASLLYMVYLRTPEASALLASGQAPSVAPGPLAYEAIGVFGILAVILAGWTTANPTIYRAGLAFHTFLPKISTFWVTILAGTTATVAGLFPAFAMRLLDFVAIYGFILSPVGALIVADHYFAKKLALKPYDGLHKKMNKAVVIAWLGSCGLCYVIAHSFDVFLSFLTLPAWILCGVLYLFFSQKKRSA